MSIYYKKHIHIYIGAILVLLFSSCKSNKSEHWIETYDSNIKIWVSDADSTLKYVWNGDTFDSVANGKGILKIFANDSLVSSESVTAVFGAINLEQIVKVSDTERYVGAVKDDLFEGFGVYDKGSEIYLGHFKDGLPNGFLNWYKNGKIFYSGFWESGKFSGQGTLYKENGSIKTGEWKDGKLTQTLVDIELPEGNYKGYIKDSQPNGLGVMDYANGSTYKGLWKKGKWSGEGLYIQNTDSVYGFWANGKINGDIIYRTNDFIFEGSLLDNTPVGIGCLTNVDGSFYSGFWLDGKRNGIGDMIFSNGDSYNGEWKDNQFEGGGRYTYHTQQSYYNGEWTNGLQNGKGTYNSAQFIYLGDWEKGWMDGEGTMIFRNGDRYDGTIHENIIDGIGCYNYANGNRYEGEFVNGRISGLGIFQFKSGNRFEGEFYNGKIFGDGSLYLSDGVKTVCITGFWPINGRFPKEASILFPNGDIYEGELNNGNPTEKGTWFSGNERRVKLDKVNNSASHKANEFYKRNKETINWFLLGTSAVITAVEVATASSVVGAPIAPIAHAVNIFVNAADASMAIASASIDLSEANAVGEDNSEAIKNLSTEIGLNVAFVLVPKVVNTSTKSLNTALKNVSRSKAALLSLVVGKEIVKTTSLGLKKGKVFGKTIKLTFIKLKTGIRKVERTLIRNNSTRRYLLAAEAQLTKISHQAVTYQSFLKNIKKNPELNARLLMSSEGSSNNLGANMRLCDSRINKWILKNERIRRYLSLPKRQVEPHHIVPSNPTTERGRQARQIWIKYFKSVDHPCNGIWLGRSHKTYGYKALAKGANHSPNSTQYEELIANAIINTEKKYSKQFANNTEAMQKVLAETVDNLKLQLYKGDLAIGTNSHSVHTVWSIFRDKGIVLSNVNNITRSINSFALE
ncbi:MORN repeat-containing protein [Macellibacteroides fermentans]|uniref:MORN repeat-containing protein n=1 Tax=Macellibacteroides fermentans TaxID=879969 RepID=UPI00406CA025